MASTVKELREKSRKTVTLKSGIEVEIKKVPSRVFVGVGELPFSMGETELPDSDDRKENGSERFDALEEERRYLIKTIMAGAVNPKFSDQEDARESDTVAHIDDLGDDEKRELASAILDWSGFSGGGAADADNFRTDGVGDNGGRTGDPVPRPSE